MSDKTETELCHPDHHVYCYKWERARTVIAGEDDVKGKGEKYLTKLEGQSSDEYTAYKDRAKYLNATGRTQEGLHGMVFRKDPQLKIPTESASLAKEMAALQMDCTLSGQSLFDYAKVITKEVIGVGRTGTLVDFEGVTEQRPYFTRFDAEKILNWQTARVNGKTVLSMVLLSEQVDQPVSEATKQSAGEDSMIELTGVCIEQLRMLLLVDGVYTVKLFQRGSETEGGAKPKWKLIDTLTPTRRAVPIPFIPFVFHNPTHSLPDCEKLPLEDIISVNLHHYRLSADYNHGLHFTALPTAWIAGFPATTTAKIGSSTAWISENTEAKAGFLEFTGQGLNAIKDAIDDDRSDMAMLGARLLEEQKKDAEAAETHRIRQTGEGSVLTSIAKATSQGLTLAMKMAYWWQSTIATLELIEDSDSSISLNTDFVEAQMPPEMLQVLVAAWIAGSISRDTMLYNFRRGELLPPGRTDEEEIELIQADPAPMPIAKPAPGGKSGAKK